MIEWLTNKTPFFFSLGSILFIPQTAFKCDGPEVWGNMLGVLLEPNETWRNLSNMTQSQHNPVRVYFNASIRGVGKVCPFLSNKIFKTKISFQKLLAFLQGKNICTLDLFLLLLHSLLKWKSSLCERWSGQSSLVLLWGMGSSVGRVATGMPCIGPLHSSLVLTIREVLTGQPLFHLAGW